MIDAVMLRHHALELFILRFQVYMAPRISGLHTAEFISQPVKSLLRNVAALEQIRPLP